ncbi:hypothetical protein JZ751_021264 [Albula glossodonta]|uniref:Uncharacterized protein n=1 Tax=Albula glossodonta TaxID=121402 RepID=A0A8T2NN83_9TELE|nr:hypothetical protein JZ751_021264 [Albula glossodonta]
MRRRDSFHKTDGVFLSVMNAKKRHENSAQIQVSSGTEETEAEEKLTETSLSMPVGVGHTTTACSEARLGLVNKQEVLRHNNIAFV